MEKKIKGGTKCNLDLLNQHENGSATHLMSRNYSDVHDLNTRQAPQLDYNEDPKLTFPSNHVHENTGLAQQNNFAEGGQSPSSQMSSLSLNLTEYSQERFQMDNPTPDYSGYQLQSHGVDHRIPDLNQYHNPSNGGAHQSVNTTGYLQDVLLMEQHKATADGYGRRTSPATADGYGRRTSPASDDGYGRRTSPSSDEVQSECNPNETSNDDFWTNPSSLWKLPTNQNASGGASFPSYSLQSDCLQSSLTVEPLLEDLYGNQQPYDSLPRRTMEQQSDCQLRSNLGEGDANLLLPPQHADCSAYIHPSSTLGYPQPQTNLPRFQNVFGVCSRRIDDTGDVGAFAGRGVEANPPSQHDVVASRYLGYTSSSYDNDSVLDMFEEESSIDDLDKKTCVFGKSARASGSPSLNEPHRREITSLSLYSPGTLTINDPFSEILNSLSSEPTYSPSSEALDSPSSDAMDSLVPNTPDYPSTPLPSGSGAIPRRSRRAPRNASTSSSQSSSSTNSTTTSQKSRSKKEKQRDRLTDAEYASMTPDDRKLRNLQLNKIASQKSRVKTKNDREFKSQMYSDQKSYKKYLETRIEGLDNVKKLMIETLFSDKSLTHQSIIDTLRARGASESLIMSLFSNQDS